MASSDSHYDDFDATTETSPLVSYLDQIELILTTPTEFRASTPQDRLSGLLERVRGCANVDELGERVDRVQRWCGQLADACRAAFARDTISEFVDEVEDWGEWTWDSTSMEVDGRRGRVREIKNVLGELPIEWLKTRVTGTTTLLTC
jgi:hypothetical protein